MKKLNLSLAGILFLAMISLFGCKKEDSTSLSSGAKPKPVTGTVSCADNYQVNLLPLVKDAFTTTFTWTITNLRPGNGNGGTTQNLSHWTFIPGCPGIDGLEQNWDDLLHAYYSLDGGVTFNEILPTPELAPDPSQTCTPANVFKFNQGTNGSTPTYYRVVLSGNYASADNTAFFKSGANTGCCTKTIVGIGCKTIDECSLSQGYYFAKPGPTWGVDVDGNAKTVAVGGKTYTEAEGRAIFACSNVGGIADSKKGFTQVASLYLSGVNPAADSQLAADVATVETYLLSLNKLVACSYLPTGNLAVAAAAGRIGDWINENHCP